MSPRERTPEELAEDIDHLRTDMTNQISGVTTQVGRLADRLDAAPFVRKDLHDEQLDRVRTELTSLHSLTMWTLGLLCSAIVGAIITLVVTLVGGSG